MSEKKETKSRSFDAEKLLGALIAKVRESKNYSLFGVLAACGISGTRESVTLLAQSEISKSFLMREESQKAIKQVFDEYQIGSFNVLVVRDEAEGLSQIIDELKELVGDELKIE